jgi:hypothetical protein
MRENAQTAQLLKPVAEMRISAENPKRRNAKTAKFAICAFLRILIFNPIKDMTSL